MWRRRGIRVSIVQAYILAIRRAKDSKSHDAGVLARVSTMSQVEPTSDVASGYNDTSLIEARNEALGEHNSGYQILAGLKQRFVR